ncbi:MAG: hypothetical protein HY331_01505 [Chloroflexi bacterium]|nr:hypothetical protein [Chloroflexota bacterium]
MTTPGYVELSPDRPWPGEARLVDYGVAVWALVTYWRKVDEDVAHVARAYDLPVEAVEAALEYYRQHKEAIDARVAANIAAFAA